MREPAGGFHPPIYVLDSLMASLNIGVMIVGITTTATAAKRVEGRWLIYLSFGLLTLGLGATAMAPSLPLLFAARC